MMRYASLFCLLLINSFSIAADTKEYSIELSLLSSEATWLEQCSVLPENPLLLRVVLTADVVIDKEELQLLIELKEGSVLTKNHLMQVIKQLQKKQKFDRIFITLRPEADGYELIIHLRALWTLSKVYIEGTILGKDRYRQHYKGEPGEPFDEIKHQHGLEGVYTMLRSEGYLSPSVVDTLRYEKTTKSVYVTLQITPGLLFTIDHVELSIAGEDQAKDELERFGSKLQKMVRRELIKAPYTKTLVDEVARQLKQSLVRKGYLDAKIELEEYLNKEAGSIRLCWKIYLHHRKEFAFVGNHFFSHDRLLEQLLLFGKSLALIPPSLLAEEISACYKKKGFLEVVLSWYEEKEHVFFCITEGPRASITDVIVEGASATIKDMVRSYFEAVLRASSFDTDIIQQALDKVVQAAVRDGFWDSVIRSYEYVPLGDGTYTLLVRMHEGERRFLKSVELVGFEELQHRGPFSTKPLSAGKIPFDFYLLQEQRMVLTRYLQERGYLYASPHAELITTEDGINVTWKIAGNTTPVRFGETIILGSSNLPSSLILRELEYRRGDIWSKQKLDRSLQRLRALGIFESISVYPEQVLEAEPSKVVLIRYLLDDPFEIRTRVGAQIVGRNVTYRGGATYKIGGSFVIKNPTNRADSFHLDMDFTRYRRDIAAYYSVPWIGHIPLKAEFRIYSSSYDQPIVVGSNEQLYRALHDGFLLEFTKDLPHFQVAMNIGLEWMTLTGVSPERALALHFEPRLVGVHIPYFFFEPTLFVDYLDDKVQPTKGSLTLMAMKGMFPFDVSRAFFLKMLVEQSLFFPLPQSIVLGVKIRLGHIVHENFRSIMPPERFYLGGIHSLRGYDPDLAPPLSCFTDCSGIRHLIPIGGKSMFNGSVELRLPLLMPLWGILFTDLGFLAQDSWSTVNADDLLAASGFGLRYMTPFGPISFDIGWKWRRQSPLERTFAWFLSFGQSF
jgi:outer membrane protein insertion porin family